MQSSECGVSVVREHVGQSITNTALTPQELAGRTRGDTIFTFTATTKFTC